MRIVKYFLIIILSTLLIGPVSAQMKRKDIKRNNKAIRKFHGNKNTFTKEKKYSYIAFSINTLNYLGEIAPKAQWGSTKISNTRPGFSLTYGHRFGPRYSVRGSFSIGRLQADDNIVADPSGDNSKFRWVRNTSFRNDIMELSAVAVIDLYKNEGSYLSRVNLTPYFLAGIAGFHHNPKAKVPSEYVLLANTPPTAFPNAGEWVALPPLGTEGQHSEFLVESDANYGIKPYSLWQISIPIGIGARYRLADALDISFDISMRWLFTDYIDDVSRNYVDLGVLDSDLARAMSNRSRDPLSANGDVRDLSGWSTRIYTGRDGVAYEVINGFGEEFPTNNRGGSSVNDIYFVTSFRIAYVLGGKFRRAKFR
jgi:hypothetical protein